MRGRVIAVGDRAQSIYQWRSASSKSMDELRDRFNMRELPLSISYRCPRAVVQKAKQWVPQIESHEAAVDGFVGEEGTDWKGQAAVSSAPMVGQNCVRCGCTFTEDIKEYCKDCSCGCRCEYETGSISKWKELKDFSAGDVILCRLTRPLVAAAFALIRARIPARVLGRDIGQGLTKLIERVSRMGRVGPQDSIGAFEEALGEFWAKQREKLAQKGKKAEIGQIEDKVATIRAFIDGMEVESGRHNSVDSIDNTDIYEEDEMTVADLTRKIERLFSDNGQTGVTLSTVHKAKGLEWDRVFILDAGGLMPWKWATQDWELAQERNLMYVAATRSRRELRYIRSEELGIRGDF